MLGVDDLSLLKPSIGKRDYMPITACGSVEEFLDTLGHVKTHSDLIALLRAASESVLNEWFLVANPESGFDAIYCELKPSAISMVIRECDECWYFVSFPGLTPLRNTQFIFTPEDIHRKNWEHISDLFYQFWYRAGGQRAGEPTL